MSETLELLQKLAEVIEEEISNRDGEQSWADWGCGNCEAGTPTPHSLGCRVKNLLLLEERRSAARANGQIELLAELGR